MEPLFLPTDSLTVVFTFSFWLSVCIYGAVNVIMLLSFAKFNTGMCIMNPKFSFTLGLLSYPCIRKISLLPKHCATNAYLQTAR